MKTKYRFMGLIGSLVCFGAGANAYADTEFLPDELLENPPAIMNPELQEFLPGFEFEFSMKFVPPAPGANYKIVKVTPDPDIDYKIRFAGPGAHLPLMEPRTRSQNMARENFQCK